MNTTQLNKMAFLLLLFLSKFAIINAEVTGDKCGYLKTTDHIEISNIECASRATISIKDFTPSSLSLVDLTKPGGAVSESNNNSPGSEGINNLVDNGLFSKYLTFSPSTTVNYVLDKEYVLSGYTLTAANDAPERDPSSWTLEGSKNGNDWEIIDARSGNSFPSRFHKNEFYFQQEKTYSQVRFKFNNTSGNIFQLAELEIFGEEDSVIPPGGDCEWGDDFYTPTVDFKNLDGVTIGSQIFDQVIPDPISYMQQRCLDVAQILYRHSSEAPKFTKLTFELKNENFVAYKYGNGAEIGIAVSTQHLANIYSASGNNPQVIKDEIDGILFHEVTHAYNISPIAGGTYDGSSPFWAYTEGIADAVRIHAGFHQTRTPNLTSSKWLQGYTTTGFFLHYVSQVHDKNFLYKFNKAASTLGSAWSFDNAFRQILGKSVEALWSEYETFINLNGRLDYDGNYPWSLDCTGITITPLPQTDDLTEPGGPVSETNNDSPTNEKIENLVDDNSNTKYLTFNPKTTVNYTFDETYVISGYTLTSANDAPERDPSSWTLEGSNNGSSWVTLDSRSGNSFSSRYELKEFSFENELAYSHVRFVFNNTSGSIFQLAELEIFGEKGDVVEEELGNISGSVIADTNNDDTGDTPLEGISINLLDTDGSIVQTATTTADGSYSFSDVQPGDYTLVQASAPNGDYIDLSDIDQSIDANDTDGDDGATPNNQIPVTLTSGETDADNNFVDQEIIILSGIISGSVIADTNNDDTGDTPLEGITINLLDSDGSIVQTATTTADGSYSFSDVQPGDYTLVQATAPNGDYLDLSDIDQSIDANDPDGDDGATPNNQIPVTLTSGETDADNNFVDQEIIILSGIISGSVIADTNNDDTGDTPLEGITINLLDTDGSIVQTATTSADGSYSFSDVQPGDYTLVQASAPNGDYLDLSDIDQSIDANDPDGDDGATPNNQIPVTLTSGETDADNNFVDQEIIILSGIISGSVIADTNNDDTGDTPLEGITINLLDTDGSIVQTATTGADGSYSFSDVQPGDYTLVQASAPNGDYLDLSDIDQSIDANDPDGDDGATPNNQIPVTLTSGETDADNNFVDQEIIDTPGGDCEWGDDFYTPTVDFKNLDGVTIGSQIFDQVIPDPISYMQQRCLDVAQILYRHSSEAPKFTKLTFELKNENFVAYKYGNGAEIGIAVSTQHLANIYSASGNNPQVIKDEIDGILFHEVTHAYNISPIAGGTYDGSSPFWAYTEGIADAVRIHAGFHQTRTPDLTSSKWLQGYTTTGFFLHYVSQVHDKNFLYKFNKAASTLGSAWSFDNAFRQILGKSVEALWSEYETFINLNGRLDYDGNYPWSLDCTGITITPIPQTDDLTEPGGPVSETHNDSPTNEKIENLVDDNSYTKYLTFNPKTTVNYTFDETYVISGYTLTSANDAPERDPSSWTLEGSNNGSSWVTLDSRSGNSFSSRYELKEFSFENELAYSHVRFVFNNTSGSIFQLAELEIFGEKGDVVEEELGNISGSVIADTNNDDTGDTPLEGITINLLDTDGSIVQTATTTADGSYSFSDVQPGDYTLVQASAPNGDYLDLSDIDQSIDANDPDGDDGATPNNQIPVTLTAGETDADNNFVDQEIIILSGIISGSVTADTNNDDTGDTPLEGITINLLDTDGSIVQTATTTADGSYSFSDVQPGDYTLVQATAPNGDYLDLSDIDQSIDANDPDGDDGATPNNQIPVTLTSGETDADNNFVDQEIIILSGIISGSVTADTNNDDTGDTPLEGITINLLDSDGSIFQTATTSADGSYSFSDVQPGDYILVQASAPNGDYLDLSDIDQSIDANDPDGDDGATPNNQIPVTLTSGETDADNNFVDQEIIILSGIISGSVTADTNNDDTGDTPLEGITINLLDTNGTIVQTATTGADGSYSFSDVQPGDYTLIQASAPNGDYLDLSDIDQSIDANDPDGDDGATPNNQIPVTLTSGETDADNNFVEDKLGDCEWGADFITPNVVFRNLDGVTIGSQIFDQVIPDPISYMQQRCLDVAQILYRHSSEAPKFTKLTFELKNENFVAYKYGNGAEIGIAVSTQHLANIYAASGNNPQVIKDEIDGILFHEVTHAYNISPIAGGTYDGSSPFWAYTEGIADAVRIHAGFHQTRTPNLTSSKWLQGYTTTGFFLHYVSQVYDKNFLYKFNKAASTLGSAWSFDNAFRQILGKSVHALWSEYDTFIKLNGRLDYDGNYPWSLDCSETDITPLPIRIDLTEPGGPVSETNNNSPTYERIPNLVDDNKNSKYLSFNSKTTVNYTFDDTYVISGYTLTSANDAPERDPSNWILEGSNNGSNWVILDSRYGNSFSSRYELKEFSFENERAYSHVRFVFNNTSGSIFQLAELEIFGEQGDVVVEQRGIISGSVTADTDNDDIGDMPLDGISIELVDTDGSLIQTATTDINGTYSFSDIESGDYTLVQATDPIGDYQDLSDIDQSINDNDPDGDDLATPNNQIPVTLTAGEADTDNDFVEQEMPTVNIDRTEPGGDIESNKNGPRSKQADKLVDDNHRTKFVAYSRTAAVNYIFDKKYVISGYSLTSANNIVKRDPASWTLKGSNNGVNWETIDTRSGNTFDSRNETKEFSIPNTTAYSHIQFAFRNTSGSRFQLAELEVFGKEDPLGSEILITNSEDPINESSEITNQQNKDLSQPARNRRSLTKEISKEITSLEIYPNPVYTTVNIIYGKEITTSINVISFQGTLLFTKKNVSFSKDKVVQLELDLPSGLYLLEIDGTVKQVLINRN